MCPVSSKQYHSDTKTFALFTVYICTDGAKGMAGKTTVALVQIRVVALNSQERN